MISNNRLALLCSATRVRLVAFLFLAMIALLCGSSTPAWAQTATSTTFEISANGNPVTTVSPQTLVTLTASVTAGSLPVTTGQVKFCDAEAVYCGDFHLFGIAQLTSAGTATLKVVPPIGIHAYKAVFAGTSSYATSTSTPIQLNVPGAYSTSTSASVGGSGGAYTLSATVSSTDSPTAPVGTVDFLDQSNSNLILGAGNLFSNPPQLSWNQTLNLPSTLVINGRPFAIADINGDGRPDLITFSSEDTVQVSFGNGNGTFAAPFSQTFPGLKIIGNLSTADFNSDGKLDLVALDSATYKEAVFLGNGDGTFAAPLLSPSSTPNSLLSDGGNLLGDFNRDGKTDIAFIDSTYTNVVILLGNGDGTFTGSSSFSATPPNSQGTIHSLVAADLNGNGVLDLAWLMTWIQPGGELNTDTLVLALGNGDGTFQPFSIVSDQVYGPSLNDASVSNMVVADFNGDGKADLGVAGFQEDCCSDINLTAVFLSQGGGTFSEALTYETGFTATIGDFNHDGIPDLLTSQLGGPVGIDDSLSLYPVVVLGNGDGTFSPPTQTSINQYGVYAIADLNGDGVSDFVANYNGSNVVVPTDLTQSATAIAYSTPLTAPPAEHDVVAAYSGFENIFLPSQSSSFDLGLLSANTPAVTLSSTDVQFGNQQVNVTSNPITVVLTNSGNAPLQLTGFALNQSPSAYAFTRSCPATLSAGVSCNIVFKVTPQGTGVDVAQLGISGNAPNSSQVITLTVNGVANPNNTLASVLGSPVPGTTLIGPSATFNWSANSGVAEYILEVGTTGVGSSNIYNSHGTTVNQLTVTGIPTNGETLYVRLYSLISGAFQYNDYTYTVAESETIKAAAITSPAPGSQFTGTSQTFTWSTGSGASEYLLRLGTTGLGSSNLYNPSPTTANEASVSGLPANGTTVYVRLYSLINGAWQYNDYTYTAEGTTANAALTSPVPGSALTSSAATFSWSSGTGATKYMLQLGTNGAGSANLYNAGPTTATQATATGLPTNGATIYARLSSYINAAWQYNDYTYSAYRVIVPATITSPSAGSQLTGTSQTFTWSRGTGPTAYELCIGTTGSGSCDVYNSGSTTANEASVTTLLSSPTTLYARIYSLIDGAWQYTDYVYTTQ